MRTFEEGTVDKKGQIYFTGKVIDTSPNYEFSVRLSNGVVCKAFPSGQLKLKSIFIVKGDEVRVVLSIHDLSTGRIEYRFPRKVFIPTPVTKPSKRGR